MARAQGELSKGYDSFTAQYGLISSNANRRAFNQDSSYQKYFENGEYLRSAEMDEEQNYNMIDGRINNQKKKPKVTDSKKRKFLLKFLHQKQDELEKRYGKKSQEVEMERNRK